MNPEEKRDYSAIAAIAARFGFRQSNDRFGSPKSGFFQYRDSHAEADLTACDCTDEAVIKTILDQFSEQIDDMHHSAIEHDLNS
jgi:hypothetical protein